MDLLYLAYANSQEDPLKALNEEDKIVHDLLSERAFQYNHYNLNRATFTTIPDIIDYLTSFKDQICLFHYSGHAGKDSLLIQDTAAYAKGIAQLLLECPSLKLVVLNGCSTKGQVEALLNENGGNGVPVVIATSRPINDKLATIFAKRFYQAMAEDFATIDSAFSTAMAAVQTVSNTIEYDHGQNRGIITRKEKEDQPLWGIYCRHNKAVNLEWTLPGEFVKKDSFPDFKPNQHLFKALFINLAPYKQEIKKLLTEEAELSIKIQSIKEKDRMVLRSLPHTISEQLRVLRAAGRGEPGETFFNELGKPRLQQLIRTYHATIKLVVYILLAQLWDLIKHDPDKFKFTDEEKEIFRSVFQQKKETEKGARYEKLINLIMGHLTAEDNILFVAEIKNPDNHFHKNDSFTKACRRIESVEIEKVDSMNISKIVSDCVDVEKHLAELFTKVLFLSKYRLASVKNINVKNQRHFPRPRFLHTIVELEHDILDFDESIEALEHVMDDSSVILCRCKEGATGSHQNQYDAEDDKEDQPRYLNLSPFLFDKNAFNIGAPIPEILYFNSYQEEFKDLIFYPIYKKNDETFPLSSDKNFSNIKNQFDKFSMLIFEQSLEDVL